jgi:hypothetical protein
MEAEIVTAVVEIIPFGNGGAEIGMTRAEMYDRIDNLYTESVSYTTLILQITFAWLIAMFFVAHRLSRPQLFVVAVFFAWFYFESWDLSLGAHGEIGAWYQLLAPGGIDMLPPVDVSWSHQVIKRLLWSADSEYRHTLPFWIFGGCIWWAFSCRRNQPKELGSPL